jgi:hypothetical protein
MKKYQQNADFKPLWGLKRKPLTTKSKEERILETVNRMVSRIQNNERKCLGRNLHTKPVLDFQQSSRMKCTSSVRNIR